MLQVLNVLVDICLLRRGPQHLPASSVLAVILVIAYAAMVALAESLLVGDDNAWRWAAASLAMLAVVLYVVLSLRGFPGRYGQTLAAVCGCGALYLAVYLPLTMALDTAPGESVSTLTSVLLLCWIALFFWGFLIEGNIYRHALGLSLPGGVLLSVLLFAAASALYRLMFPGTP